MWSPNELLKIEKQRDILSYITLQFFHFKKVPLEHCPFDPSPLLMSKNKKKERDARSALKYYQVRSLYGVFFTPLLFNFFCNVFQPLFLAVAEVNNGHLRELVTA